MHSNPWGLYINLITKECGLLILAYHEYTVCKSFKYTIFIKQKIKPQNESKFKEKLTFGDRKIGNGRNRSYFRSHQ